jgi:uncharacterized membrane-anchored protein YitT (DUF2179 family)
MQLLKLQKRFDSVVKNGIFTVRHWKHKYHAKKIILWWISNIPLLIFYPGEIGDHHHFKRKAIIPLQMYNYSKQQIKITIKDILKLDLNEDIKNYWPEDQSENEIQSELESYIVTDGLGEHLSTLSNNEVARKRHKDTDNFLVTVDALNR